MSNNRKRLIYNMTYTCSFVDKKVSQKFKDTIVEQSNNIK